MPSSAYSAYSPFFTSGLLSDPSSPADNARTWTEQLGPRRGSLPTDAVSSSMSLSSEGKVQSPVTDESAAFYFTLQPRRDPAQLRSFLSLDLAESQSIYEASIRRRANSNAQPPAMRVPSASRPAPTLRRSSRDSMRPIPSPKPVPSSSLPALPAASRPAPPAPKPVLPPIAPVPRISIRLSAFLSAAPAKSPPAPQAKPRSSWRSPKAASAAPSPAASAFSVLARSVSIASTERRASRADALATLEGRRSPVSPSPASPVPSYASCSSASCSSCSSEGGRDFMDMSDEEGYLDPLPLVSPTAAPSIWLSPPSPPTPAHALEPKGKAKARKEKKSSSRARRADSWIPAPLASFIDLRDDEPPAHAHSAPAGLGAWNWRSFIEVGGTS